MRLLLLQLQWQKFGLRSLYPIISDSLSLTQNKNLFSFHSETLQLDFLSLLLWGQFRRDPSLLTKEPSKKWGAGQSTNGGMDCPGCCPVSFIYLLLNLFLFYSMCMDFFLTYALCECVCQAPWEVRRGYRIPWIWSCRWLRVVMQVLGIKPSPLEEKLLTTESPL